ncbi:hypothetical protein U6A24_14310 [Aquimarina gracilis]|uniref:Uncharacterized protein n=1 Tax=Aquimarina gracilis TaxID=874422 RepID=A0ABU5ZXR5_9FLAO|nr:hypothetical protein [Aquimarina gracilis]MEB3346648.1 hypothetical protein [Aquimarina gracilis]
MKKKIFKLLKILALSTITLIIIAIATLYFSLNQELPQGTTGTEADNFALKIQEAVKHKSYLNTDYIQWSFRNKHHYLWNKKQGTAKVQWEDYIVHLDLNYPEKSYLENKNIKKEKKKELITTAFAYFNNDSFWVVAPHKLFDKGVTRQLITLEDTSKGLLVTYSTGGTTPGDSYLWKVDENYVPKSYQMWVSIIPIGGIEATWNGWTSTESGAYLSQKHELLGFGIPISNLRAWNKN